MDRRDWLGRVARGGLGAGGALALGTAAAAGATADDAETALARLGVGDAAVDPRLVLDVAADAWNGDFVIVRVDASGIDGVRELRLLRDDHVPASIVRVALQGALPARLSVPIRLERPCRLLALARTAGGWLRADGAVRAVGAPGCG